jgi:hypothetical protein
MPSIASASRRRLTRRRSVVVNTPYSFSSPASAGPSPNASGEQIPGTMYGTTGPKVFVAGEIEGRAPSLLLGGTADIA